jgi:hypothetical protein
MGERKMDKEIRRELCLVLDQGAISTNETGKNEFLRSNINYNYYISFMY